MKPLSEIVARTEPSATLVLTALARALQADGVDVVTLTAGEPDFPTPQHIKDAAKRAIEENRTTYTLNAGTPELRQAIVQKFRTDNDLAFDTSQILVSNGAKHSLANALQAICNKGDEVLVPAPYWVSYPQMVILAGATPVIVATSEENEFKLTAEQLKRAVTPQTKALILCTPSNPTGTVYSRHDLEELAGVIADTGIYVIADEIYEKVIYDGAAHVSIGSLDSIRNQVVTVNGMSKAYSMTGWRIGFLGASREITSSAERVQSQTTSNASSISQYAALAALTGPQDELLTMGAEYDRRRQFIHAAVTSIPGIRCQMPKGAFYVFPNVSHYFGRSAGGRTMNSCDDLAKFLLDEERVAVVPGSSFGSKNHLRISYSCAISELEKAAERLERGFRKLE